MKAKTTIKYFNNGQLLTIEKMPFEPLSEYAMRTALHTLIVESGKPIKNAFARQVINATGALYNQTTVTPR